MYESAAESTAAFKVTCNIPNLKSKFHQDVYQQLKTWLHSKVKQEQQHHLQQQDSILHDRRDSHLRDKLVELVRFHLV